MEVMYYSIAIFFTGLSLLAVYIGYEIVSEKRALRLQQYYTKADMDYILEEYKTNILELAYEKSVPQSFVESLRKKGEKEIAFNERIAKLKEELAQETYIKSKSPYVNGTKNPPTQVAEILHKGVYNIDEEEPLKQNDNEPEVAK